MLRVVHCPDSSFVDAELPLNGATYTFGRSPDVAYPVSDHRMSRQHFRLVEGAAGYLVEDLDSTNGTFLDGRPVRGRLPLDGQVVAAGDTLFVVDGLPDRDALPAAAGADGEHLRSIVGRSNAMRALRASVVTVARTPGGVLLLGPTGAGKEVTARAIHAASERPGPFIPVNCAAIPTELAETEFFGHDKGAFTGADKARPGAFRASSGGTLFLDEVGDLPVPLQAKLLRVLEDGIVQPLGGSSADKVDLRVVAATHEDLEGGEFRRDLLARLCDWTLRLPPLSDRKADILPLFQHFLSDEGHGGGEFDAEVAEALLLHDWPMNVRELRKLARRLVVLTGPHEPPPLSSLPAELRAPLERRYGGAAIPAGRPSSVTSSGAGEPRPLSALGDDDGSPDRQTLENALADARGNVKLAAQRSGWHRTQLYRWLKRHGIDPARYR